MLLALRRNLESADRGSKISWYSDQCRFPDVKIWSISYGEDETVCGAFQFVRLNLLYNFSKEVDTLICKVALFVGACKCRVCILDIAAQFCLYVCSIY